jgi:hypothetical protein
MRPATSAGFLVVSSTSRQARALQQGSRPRAYVGGGVEGGVRWVESSHVPWHAQAHARGVCICHCRRCVRDASLLHVVVLTHDMVSHYHMEH